MNAIRKHCTYTQEQYEWGVGIKLEQWVGLRWFGRGMKKEEDKKPHPIILMLPLAILTILRSLS